MIRTVGLHFRRLTPLAITLILVLAGTWPLWQTLFSLWSQADTPYSHGGLIGAVSLALLAHRYTCPTAPGTPRRLLALTLLLTTALAYLLHLVSIQSAQLLLLPLILWLALAITTGLPTARALGFPAVFLLFAIPVWGPFVAPLQFITTQIAGGLLGLGGISLSIHGNLIQIPAGTFEVADGCAGLKYFLTSFALASLYAALFLSDLKKRLLLVAWGLLLAMLTNWVRVSTIVLVGHLTAMQHPLIADHDNLGWLLYGISLIPFYGLAYRLSSPASPSSPAATPAPLPFPTLLLTLLALLIPALTTVQLMRSATFTWTTWQPQNAIPVTAGSAPWTPRLHDAIAHHTRHYTRPPQQQPFELHTYYVGEPWRDEIRHYEDDYFPAPWTLLDTQRPTVPNLGSTSLNRLSTRSGRQRLVLYWYGIGTHGTASPALAKAWQALALLTGKMGGSIHFLTLDCASDCTQEMPALLRFAQQLTPVTSTTLPET